MKKLLLILSVITLLTSCSVVDEDHIVIKVPDSVTYRAKRGSVVHNENGCITFRAEICDDGKERNVTVCGNYIILE